MTDNEIIKAFEYCFNKNEGVLTVVNNGEQNIITVGDVCKVFARQKAEIERLESELKTAGATVLNLHSAMENIKAEAVKEFEEELWFKVFNDSELDTGSYVRLTKHIDDTKKEMVGDV